jgi:hypothetical protein
MRGPARRRRSLRAARRRGEGALPGAGASGVPEGCDRGAGEDPLAPILQARVLNPHYVEVTRYECMAYASRLAQAGSAASHSEARRSLREILKSRSYQFGAADPWFGKVRSMIE